MGAIATCGRIFLVLVNLLFLVLGLVLLALGLFIRFGSSIYDTYIENVKSTLTSSASSSGFGTLDFSNFNLSEILLPLALGLIFIGLFLTAISLFGCCGSCYKIKAMLLAYVVVCVVLLLAQLIVVGILYGSPDTFHDPAKKSLKDGIQSDYMGLNGTNLVSLGWNIVMQKVECCGAKDYSDFTGATYWVIDYTGGSYSPAVTLKTPLACCMTLPSSNDFSCADLVTATDANNYQSIGCYEKIWDDTLGNSTIMIAALVSIGVFQLVLIIFGVVILLSDKKKKNKTGHKDY